MTGQGTRADHRAKIGTLKNKTTIKNVQAMSGNPNSRVAQFHAGVAGGGAGRPKKVS